MNKCEICGKLVKYRRYCTTCRYRAAMARELYKACNEFKKTIGYDEILRLREERERKNGNI